MVDRVLQVTFVKGKLNATDGGASWRYRFEKSFDEFTVEYKVMMAKNGRTYQLLKMDGFFGNDKVRLDKQKGYLIELMG